MGLVGELFGVYYQSYLSNVFVGREQREASLDLYVYKIVIFAIYFLMM